MESAKRSRDDFESDQAPQQAGRSYEEYDKRQRIDATQELINNVCKDLRCLGENPSIASQVDDMLYMLNPIVAEFEVMELLRSSVLNTILAVITEQPQRIGALANVIFICNAKNFVVTRYVIDFLHLKLTAMLLSISSPDILDAAAQTMKTEMRKREDAGPFNNIKLILKFLATLSPIIKEYAVVEIFRQFLTLAIELQNHNPAVRNGIAQEIFYNVLIALPYFFCNDNSPELVAKLNDLVEYAHKFPIIDPQSSLLLQPFDSKLGNYEMPYVPKKMIDLILPAIVNLQGPQKSWEGIKKTLFLDYSDITQPIIADALANNPISKELVTHDIAPLDLPTVDALLAWEPVGLVDKLWYETPRLLFQVYTMTEFTTVPPIETYFGLFFKDLSFDILTNLSFNKTEASMQLCVLDIYFNSNLFAPPGSSIDELSLIHRDNVLGENAVPLSTFKIEDIAVESILTMIFQLPNPLHHEIFFYAVLIQCCRENSDLIAPVFGRAIRYFYNNLESLDYELKIRFMDWMTTQISNFEFIWKWDEWAPDLNHFHRLQYHPKRNFIKNLIAKEIRLSKVNIIKDSFAVLDPETQEAIPLTDFYQYLDVSFHGPHSKEILVDYDVELYGESSREILENLYEQKQQELNGKQLLSALEQMLYNCVSPELPLWILAKKIHNCVTTTWTPNQAFEKLCVESLQTIRQELEGGCNAIKFFINVLFQTYSFVGSRSIYSVVNILSRDTSKLRFVTGVPVSDPKDVQEFTEHALFQEVPEQQRQEWAVDAIFRIWSHQPQVVFLTLEYLIEFEIVDPIVVLQKTMDLKHNYIILNVSCMELVNRILKFAQEQTDAGRLTRLLSLLLGSIVENLNTISTGLAIDPEQVIEIIRDVSEEMDDAQVQSIDQRWLFYEYRGLLKSYIRRFTRNCPADFKQDIKLVCDQIQNVPARTEVITWLEEITIG